MPPSCTAGSDLADPAVTNPAAAQNRGMPNHVSTGSGPGPIAPDGCAVDVYARLPAEPDLDLIDAALPRRATVLDLGCGTGRLAVPLARRGHQVLGVDESAEMLARIDPSLPGLSPPPALRTVQARIQDLDGGPTDPIGERFDAVLLASHLINSAEPGLAPSLLRACRQHVAPGGRVLIQWHPPEWFDRLTTGAAERISARRRGPIRRRRVDLAAPIRGIAAVRAGVGGAARPARAGP
jgi:SAM-dependent methyltransferase